MSHSTRATTASLATCTGMRRSSCQRSPTHTQCIIRRGGTHSSAPARSSHTSPQTSHRRAISTSARSRASACRSRSGSSSRHTRLSTSRSPLSPDAMTSACRDSCFCHSGNRSEVRRRVPCDVLCSWCFLLTNRRAADICLRLRGKQQHVLPESSVTCWKRRMKLA